ncbi:MAG: Crp/Fnr family transcriptional regulator, partial [Rhodospirillaceae bacterium]
MKTARKRFDDKTVLFREGEKGGGAYVILAGRVDLFKEGRSGAVPLASLGKGDLVGEMALIDKGPRSATAVTVGEVVLQGLDREDLLARFARDPEMAMKILAKLSKRLRNTDDRVVSLTDRLMETGVALDDSGATPIADSEA